MAALVSLFIRWLFAATDVLGKKGGVGSVARSGVSYINSASVGTFSRAAWLVDFWLFPVQTAAALPFYCC